MAGKEQDKWFIYAFFFIFPDRLGRRWDSQAWWVMWRSLARLEAFWLALFILMIQLDTVGF
jgi:hypothetical protein